MKKVVLQIDSAGERREVTLKDEISIGRTDSADIVLPDSGLSRVNTTFFREDDEVFVVDENSTNGTFLNGEQLSGSPREIKDRDEITAGNETLIFVEIYAEKTVTTAPPADKKTPAPKKAKKAAKTTAQQSQLPMIPIVAGLSVFMVAFVALVGFLIYSLVDDSDPNKGKPTAQINSALLIPIRVIDPLGGEVPEEIEELAKMLDADIEDEVKDTDSLVEIKAESTGTTNIDNGLKLDVPIAFLEQQKAKFMGPRPEPTGTDPPGQQIPSEIAGGGGVPKQTAKLTEMKNSGYRQPFDFSDLAQKRLNGELLELPVAAESFFLDVGGSASDGEFEGFDFSLYKNSLRDCYFPITPGSPKHAPLAKLAADFKLDLNNPRDRKQLRMRLLRMFHPKALPILKELADAFYNQFKIPLRVTSLTRSMDYQISLNKGNANSFKVRGPGSLPPHTSGCAFDLSRKQMTAKEQNFLMDKLAEMERRGVLDGLREGGANACFHVFIYHDGQKPKGF
jgi:pSer/pThr/pTyr-binding forkhead associated (FHA) protein